MVWKSCQRGDEPEVIYTSTSAGVALGWVIGRGGESFHPAHLPWSAYKPPDVYVGGGSKGEPHFPFVKTPANQHAERQVGSPRVRQKPERPPSATLRRPPGWFVCWGGGAMGCTRPHNLAPWDVHADVFENRKIGGQNGRQWLPTCVQRGVPACIRPGINAAVPRSVSCDSDWLGALSASNESKAMRFKHLLSIPWGQAGFVRRSLA